MSDAQVALLRKWIEEGAPWPEDASQVQKKHWAYEKPVRPALPRVARTSWARRALDYFILEKLEGEQLAPSPEADRPTLIRRASLDLIVLPPSLQEVQAFVSDESTNAFEKVVDRLLASPHYGERWARPWLDLARYADSAGYQIDPAAGTIALNGNIVELAPKEYELALLFFRNPGRLFSRDVLSMSVWNRDIPATSRTLDTHLSNIRRKLALHPENGVRLHASYALGYRLELL